MGSDASAGGATATNSSSPSPANTTAPFFVTSSQSLAGFDDPRLARQVRRARTASFDVTWGGLGGGWTGAGPIVHVASPAGRTEAVCQVTGLEVAGAKIDTTTGADEALHCDSVRRKRKRKMNKHKHSKRLRANKHKR